MKIVKTVKKEYVTQYVTIDDMTFDDVTKATEHERDLIKDMIICPKCGGRGSVHSIYTNIPTCPVCNGIGYIKNNIDT